MNDISLNAGLLRQEDATLGVTRQIAADASSLAYDDLSADDRQIVRQCVLDTVGVAIAGVDEDVTRIVREFCLREGSNPASGLICHDARVSVRQAALVNGTASHALDYDDCNLIMPGHVSAAVLPALLALADSRGSSGRDLMTAFVAGYEAASSVGAMLAPGHYDRGFHSTGTNGTLGAAAACARLMGLDMESTAHALSIAATTASGLKGLFGTMSKPFHAGRAGENGVLGAELAAAGFFARGDAIECRQGFADTHTPTYDPALARWRPASGRHLHGNLFKYHAACYGTHGVIECALQMREQLGDRVAQIESLLLEVAPENDKTCNIAHPVSSAEARFSMRHTVAMALTGHDTAAADAYGAESLADGRITRLREAMTVNFISGVNMAESFITARLSDGSTTRIGFDAGAPARDLAAQNAKLLRKFRALVSPVLGQERCEALIDAIDRLDTMPDVSALLALTQRAFA